MESGIYIVEDQKSVLVADVLIKETKPEFTGKGPQARNQDL
jgi:hypothetical protein